MIKFSAIAAIIIFCSSCSDTASVNNPSSLNNTTTTIGKSDNVITFKVNGAAVVTSGWTISRVQWSTDPGKLWLNITSNMHEDKRAIGVNLNGAVAGTYILGLENGALSNQSHGSYHPDYNDFSNSYSFVNGSFVITEVDTIKNIVNGTFSGTVKNNTGETLQVTDGKIINGTLKRQINVY